MTYQPKSVGKMAGFEALTLCSNQIWTYSCKDLATVFIGFIDRQSSQQLLNVVSWTFFSRKTCCIVSLSRLLFLLRWNKYGAKKCLTKLNPFEFWDDSTLANQGAGKAFEGASMEPTSVLSVPGKKFDSQPSSGFKLIVLLTPCSYWRDVTWNLCIWTKETEQLRGRLVSNKSIL